MAQQRDVVNRLRIPQMPHDADSNLFLKRLMAPEPIVPIDLLEAKRGKPVEDWAEIAHNVLGAFWVRFRSKATVNISAGSQAIMQRIYGGSWFDQMLENVHCCDKVERLLGRIRVFEINEGGVTNALAKPVLFCNYERSNQCRGKIRRVCL